MTWQKAMLTSRTCSSVSPRTPSPARAPPQGMATEALDAAGGIG